LITAQTRRALAVILPLTLVLLIARIAHAGTDPEPVAAMIARVAPAIVRVVTVRLAAHQEDKPGAQTAQTARIDRDRCRCARKSPPDDTAAGDRGTYPGIVNLTSTGTILRNFLSRLAWRAQGSGVIYSAIWTKIAAAELSAS